MIEETCVSETNKDAKTAHSNNLQQYDNFQAQSMACSGTVYGLLTELSQCCVIRLETVLIVSLPAPARWGWGPGRILSCVNTPSPSNLPASSTVSSWGVKVSYSIKITRYREDTV